MTLQQLCFTAFFFFLWFFSALFFILNPDDRARYNSRDFPFSHQVFFGYSGPLGYAYDLQKVSKILV